MAAYGLNVFINCPLDGAYARLMESLVFAVHDCGFVARSALEIDDGSQPRIEKIYEIILGSRFGIHDLSRTELDPDSMLPRFNMPLELGIFLGINRAGGGRQGEKRCLILDIERYRCQRFCSDIAGQDIRAHGGDPGHAIGEVRDWLRNQTQGSGSIMPGRRKMQDRFEEFSKVLREMCEEVGLECDELIFNDYTTLVAQWLRENS
jgi:hypothetical protein